MGAIKTNIGSADRDHGKGPLKDLPLMQPEEGAKPLVASALLEEVPRGKIIVPYWVPSELSMVLPARVAGHISCWVFEIMLQKLSWGKMRAQAPSPEAQDPALADALWQWTAASLNMTAA